MTGVKELVAQGNQALAAGNLQAAEQNFRAALAANPNRGEAYVGLAQVALAVGNGAAALELAQKGATLLPRDAAALYLAGEVSRLTGRLAEAAGFYRRALERNPRHFEAAGNLSSVLIALSQFSDAMAAAQTVTRLKPNELGGWLNLATAALGTNDAATALAAARQAVQLAPGQDQAQHSLLLALRQSGELAAALEVADRLLAANPTLAETWLVRLDLFDRLGRDDLFAIAQAACIACPSNAEIWLTRASLGVAHGWSEDIGAALEQALRAGAPAARCNVIKAKWLYADGKFQAALDFMATLPDAGAQQWELRHTAGLAARDSHDFEAAEKFFTDALKLNPGSPEVRAMLATVLFERQRLAEAFHHYEARFEARRDLHRPLAGVTRWQGEALNPGSTLVIRAEQGVGDQLLFSTLIGDALQRVGNANNVIECDSRLVSLFARAFPGAQIFAERDLDQAAQNFPRPVYDIPALSLGQFLRPDIAAFTAARTYLPPDEARLAAAREWLSSLGPGRSIGLCWRSLVPTGGRGAFYAPIEEWRPLFDLAGHKIICLQYGLSDADRAWLSAQGVSFHIMPGLDLRDDFEGCLALAAALDLVIAADTTMASLAALAGTRVYRYFHERVWTLLGTNAYPWFPKTRSFVRGRDRGWPELVQEVMGALGAE